MTKKATKTIKLVPTLGVFDATAISVGVIVGAGIYVVTGIVAGLAGPALVFSMLLASGVALLTALSFAELAAWLPKEGSVYEFAHQLVNPFVGFLAGWMWILSNTFSGAAVSIGFAHYLTALVPNLRVNFVAALTCIAFTALNYFGIRKSANLNNFLVVTKILVLVFFFIFGLGYVNAENFAPFIPSELGIFFGAYFIFFAFGGFARVSVVAEEIKDAERNVPKAILLSLVISTVLYIMVGVVAIGIAGSDNLSRSDSPLTTAISTTGSGTATFLVSMGGLLATASVLLSSILGVSRVAYAMARRKDLPLVLSRLHSRYDTPHYSILVSGFLMALFAFLVDLVGVIAISTFAQLFYYAIANISALKLKSRNRRYPMFIPALGAITCSALLFFVLFASPQSWFMGTVGIIVGAIYYVAKKKIQAQMNSFSL